MSLPGLTHPQTGQTVLSCQSTDDNGEIAKLRVCLGPRDLNKWINRGPYYTKTINEVVTQLSNAKFWHVPLDEPSSYLTTFGTPFGRFRFTRIPFGLIVSQKQLDSALEGLSGVTGIANDTFVFGSTE